MTDPSRQDGIVLAVEIAPDQLELLAQRVAELLHDDRDQGFLDADGAAAYLGTTKRALYHLVERRRIHSRRFHGRLLFDPRELREDVERSG